MCLYIYVGDVFITWSNIGNLYVVLFITFTTRLRRCVELPKLLRLDKEPPPNLTWQISNKILSFNSVVSTSDAATNDLLSHTPITRKWTL